MATFTELAADGGWCRSPGGCWPTAETPVGVYRKLAGGPGTFLLESAEQGVGSAGMAWSRYSFIGVRSSATLIERDGVATWLGQPPAGLSTEGDPVRMLRETVGGAGRPGRGPADGLPPLTGGHGRLPRLRPGPALRALPELADGRPAVSPSWA